MLLIECWRSALKNPVLYIKHSLSTVSIIFTLQSNRRRHTSDLRSRIYSQKMDAIKTSSLTRLKTLRRTVSLKVGILNNVEEETSKQCNDEFSFVNFETLAEEDMDQCSVPSKAGNQLTIAGTNLSPVTSLRGVLWTMSNNIFSSWKERFCILTENSFYSFSRKTGAAAKSISRIKLSEISDIELSIIKRQTTLILTLSKCSETEKLMLRAEKGLEEWHSKIMSNMIYFKHQLRRRTYSQTKSMRRQNMPIIGVNSLRKSQFYL